MSIKKIAEMTGVSCATVSRVLNNPDYKCSKEGQRDKIWKAAMEINYVPNEAARNLKSGFSVQKKNVYFILCFIGLFIWNIGTMEQKIISVGGLFMIDKKIKDNK